MSDLRAAAQQALEALEHHGGHLPWTAFVEVRADLRAALDAPEPVAWINYCAATGRETIDRACHSELASTPLYAAPPQRKPPTDDEIRKCCQGMDAEPLAEGWPELIKFARAIERAHGVGGGDEPR